MGQLIADCADIPPALQPVEHDVPLPRLAPAWQIDDTCADQGGEQRDDLGF